MSIENATAELTLNQYLPHIMANISKRISDNCSHIYSRDTNISVPEWRVMSRVAENPGINSKNIGEITLMDKSKVSRAVKSLEEKHLLIREKSCDDNRVSNLCLTERGLHMYQEIAPKALSWENNLLTALSDSEYQDLLRILDKLDERLRVM
ncbi:MarR family winged helix-turn-helix transcriptional regulator [Marinibactrum halimedae]|uniref:MarR family transcriptional regulator n=1 Tax=Marinibactrum halimedae TaxID=1444977 RepID=A0AA37TBV3_9GAMM|nr:MarR family winged helix-turn-helix transcriptional regulator [Marinibactrum halimedae]MCD9457939.1 MarR family winged helix-turn-helix transcriptional regulator [Marinibactrum halimedae]GLS26232.1 MarR family transcriptional regulator [Marinibactrum halimedae]